MKQEAASGIRTQTACLVFAQMDRSVYHRRVRSLQFRRGLGIIQGTAFLWVLLSLTPARSHAQSPLDGFDPGANGTIWTLAVQSDGKILVGGGFTLLGGGGSGAVTHVNIGRLNPDGSPDSSFQPATNGVVKAIAVQADGKILVGGSFTTISGSGSGPVSRSNFGRLNPDGSLDPTFDPGAGGTVSAILVQPDGRILLGGSFTAILGAPRKHIARLNANGTLDTAFDPSASAAVSALALQPDGKIVIGGSFTSLGIGSGAASRWHIARLNVDGSIDPAFDPGANGDVLALAMQEDGNIVAAGSFTTLGDGDIGLHARSRIGRLHADGTIDGTFDPGANATAYALVIQADGRIVVAGAFFTLGGGGNGTTVRNHIGRIHLDGTLDTGFNPGADGIVYALSVQMDRKILAAGAFFGLGGGNGSAPRSRIGRLNPGGSVDADFKPRSNSTVTTISVQPDGKILVGGSFTALEGTGVPTIQRNFIGRFNTDGSVDTSFNPGANDVVYSIAVQPDGKILVAGRFTRLGGGGDGSLLRNHIGRLNSDGSIDPGFNPGADGSHVNQLALQADGKILVGGTFTALGGGSGTTARSNIGRLNPDGSVDQSFNPGANESVQTLVVQPDGKILVGGDFTMLGGGGSGINPRSNIGRLNAEGSPDGSFDPGANSAVRQILLQPDGKILVAGAFTTLGGGSSGIYPRNHLGRLNSDGTLDAVFDPGANGAVNALALQANGAIVVGGNFTTLGGGGTGTATRNRIGRLLADGNPDASFDPGCSGNILALAFQADGRVLVGGTFDGLGGGSGTTARLNLGRLAMREAAYQDLSIDYAGSAISWYRSGISPEVNRVIFESSPDGANFTLLGNGTRISGGWQLKGLSLPMGENIYIRARGFYSTGYGNGSTSILESMMVAASITEVFAQVAAGGSYQTILTGINTNPVSAEIQVSLIRSDGTPFRSPSGEALEPAHFNIPTMGTARLQVALGAETVAGYGLFSGKMPIEGTALFRSYKDNRILSEAGVGLSKPTRNFTVYIDNTNNASSGYAVANDGSRKAILSLILRDNQGLELERTTVSVLPGRHFAEFANERFPIRAQAGFEGSIEFRSDQDIAAVALRYDNVNMNAESQVFSTIPVLLNEADRVLYFPQVAEGEGYRTNFILMNPQDTNATINLEFFKSDGTPLSLLIGGVRRTNYDLELPPRGVGRFFTEGQAEDLKVGWVRATSRDNIVGSSIFQTVGSNRILSEAGVSWSPVTQHFSTYVESVGSAWSGIAICNPHSSQTTLTLNLRNSNGEISLSTTVTLPAFGHTAKFFDDAEWFPQAENFEGTLEVIASAPVSAVALRYDNPDHNVFATLPVVLLR